MTTNVRTPARPPMFRINGGWWQFITPLRYRTAFITGGNMRGTPGPAETLGQLPSHMRPWAEAADYVVYSYQTPIAWHCPPDHVSCPPGATSYPDGWVYPDVRYSITTCKQQGRIVTALSVLQDSAYDQYDTVLNPPAPAPLRTRGLARHPRNWPAATAEDPPRIPGPGPDLDPFVFGYPVARSF